MMRRPLPCLAALLLLAACRQEAPPTKISAVDALSASVGRPAEGFAKALEPRPFDFPADHGPHPDFETEWWYFTGNLESGEGRRFGFQLTFFRRAITAEETKRESAWATRQLYFAHFTVSDVEGRRFHSFERFARGALGLAEANAAPFRVATEGWQAASSGESLFPLRLAAKEGEVSLELELEDAQGWVAHGERGLSRKGEGEGKASYYYSYPRLPARGKIAIACQAFAVKGEAWLDREWSTSVLAEGQQGWDWFSLQLEDGRELMLFQLRRRDGSRDPFSAGTLVAVDGSSQSLAAGDFELEPRETWKSPRSGAVYPIRWRLALPRHGLELETKALLEDQELDVSFSYWEGAVDAEGRQGEKPLRGRGYLEMVGYAETP
jgi:predicted secreted hydrolase